MGRMCAGSGKKPARITEDQAMSISPDPVVDFAVKGCVDSLGAENVREIWFFGSRTSGEPRPDSDWDLFVVLQDHGPPDYGMNQRGNVELMNKIRKEALDAGVTAKLDDIDIFTAYGSLFDDAAQTCLGSPCANARGGVQVWGS